MECDRIKELLSDYVDGTVGAQAKADVEEHISTCKACREELASLSAMLRELRSLEPVRAPADFLESLHERMEPSFSFDKILNKLFMPLRIKIPLQLAAAAAVAVLVLFVLSIEHEETQMLKAPIVSTHESLEEDSLMAHSKLGAEKEAKRPAPVPQEAEQEQPVREAEPVELVLLLKRAGREKAYAPGADVGAAPPAESDVIEGKGERAFMGSAERKAQRRMREDRPKKEEQAMPRQMAGKRMMQDEARLSLSYENNPLSTLNRAVRLVEGKVLGQEYDQKTGQLETIRVEIPSRHYGLFCEELRRLGALKDPPPTLMEKGQETVRVRMKFVSSP